MKKTEFQKLAYSEVSKLFLKLFNEGKVNKCSSERKVIGKKLNMSQSIKEV